MKLYNSMGPNPHVVRMYAAECGVDLELEEVDLMGGANRQSDYLALNPAGQLPCLVMANGDLLAEITAICEYLDEQADGVTLLGDSAEERASVRMWTRRVDLNICEPLTSGFRYSEGLGLFKERMITIPDAADGLKQIAKEKTAWLDGLMADGREFSLLATRSRWPMCCCFVSSPLAAPSARHMIKILPTFTRGSSA